MNKIREPLIFNYFKSYEKSLAIHFPMVKLSRIEVYKDAHDEDLLWGRAFLTTKEQNLSLGKILLNLKVRDQSLSLYGTRQYCDISEALGTSGGSELERAIKRAESALGCVFDSEALNLSLETLITLKAKGKAQEALSAFRDERAKQLAEHLRLDKAFEPSAAKGKLIKPRFKIDEGEFTAPIHIVEWRARQAINAEYALNDLFSELKNELGGQLRPEYVGKNEAYYLVVIQEAKNLIQTGIITRNTKSFQNPFDLLPLS